MDPDSSPDPWAAVRETHCATVVLLGDKAYKVKKPVSLGFLDFTERASRRAACEREVVLNRRLAPDVYLGVGGLADPDGDTEPAVVMRRMPEHARLSRLLERGVDVLAQVTAVARILATFHAGAERGPRIDAQGTRDALSARWDASFTQVRPHTATMLPVDLLTEIETEVHRFLAGREELFDERIRRGAVVDGHGDLTIDDIFCLPDGPRLLDCLEFDDTLRHVDRLDDVSFLAMGLEDAGHPELARTLIERWAELLGDPAPPALVHHYFAYRAFVRAKVACLSGAQLDRPAPARVTRYAEMAHAHLRTAEVVLVIVGGPPGTGKTTLSTQIAERLGMVLISSDRVRKEAAGIDPHTPAPAGFGEGIYSPGHTRATYATMLHRAELLLRRGESVVLDASWNDPVERERVGGVADTVTARLVELRCTLDAVTAAARIAGRTGISDADEHIAARIRQNVTPWPSSIGIDMGRAPEDCADEACAMVRPGRLPRPFLRRRPGAGSQ